MLRTSYVWRDMRSVIQLVRFEAGDNFDEAQSECQAFCSSAQRWQSCRFQRAIAGLSIQEQGGLSSVQKFKLAWVCKPHLHTMPRVLSQYFLSMQHGASMEI